jgi:hypothetical protein
MGEEGLAPQGATAAAKAQIIGANAATAYVDREMPGL